MFFEDKFCFPAILWRFTVLDLVKWCTISLVFVINWIWIILEPERIVNFRKLVNERRVYGRISMCVWLAVLVYDNLSVKSRKVKVLVFSHSKFEFQINLLRKIQCNSFNVKNWILKWILSHLYTKLSSSFGNLILKNTQKPSSWYSHYF